MKKVMKKEKRRGGLRAPGPRGTSGAGRGEGDGIKLVLMCAHYKDPKKKCKRCTRKGCALCALCEHCQPEAG